MAKEFQVETRQSQYRELLDSVVLAEPEVVKDEDVYDLCLATTWTRAFQKGPVHKVVIGNWGNISPQIKPVLVSREEKIQMEVNSSIWSIIPEVEIECKKIPTLRGVLKAILSKFTAKLYGFSNSDLIFGKDFWTSVEMIIGRDWMLDKPLLILGKRMNIKFNQSVSYNIHDVPEIAKSGSYPVEGSSDIFITNKLFPWSNIPKIVVGRMGLGMWLVGYARAHNVTIIDITNTATILHLTTNIGIHESGYARNYTFNIDLLHDLGYGAEHFELGSLDCVEFSTEYDNTGDIMIRKREVTPFCFSEDLNKFIKGDN